jgi:hypothetical protein
MPSSHGNLVHSPYGNHQALAQPGYARLYLLTPSEEKD